VDWGDPEVRKKLASGELTVSGDQWPMLVYVMWAFQESDSRLVAYPYIYIT
jgi:hypothetical protein